MIMSSSTHPLHIKFGLNGTERVVLEHDGHLEVLESVKDKRATTFTRGILTQWSYLLVRTSITGKSSRLRIIRPQTQGEELELRHGEFYVTGQARIAHTLNNPRQVSELWKERKKIDFSESYL